MNSSKKISLKFDGKTVSLQEETIKTFDQLKQLIREKFDSLPEKIRIYYIDADNDEITISCDGDLESFEYEEKDILINIKPYSDSDVTDNEDEEEELEEEEEDEDEEEEQSSCCDSDSGEERAKVSQQNQSNDHVLQEQEKGQKVEEIPQKSQEVPKRQESEMPEDDPLNTSSFNKFSDEEFDAEEESKDNSHQKRQPNDEKKSESEQTHTVSTQVSTNQVHFEQKDQSSQIGITLKNQEQQVSVVQCDQSQQAQVGLCDASDQTAAAEHNDNSTQMQIEYKDSQSEARVESRDHSLQTHMIELQDHGTQAIVEKCDNSLQADVVDSDNFQQQVYSNDNLRVSSQQEIFCGNDEKNAASSISQLTLQYQQKIRSLEDNQSKLMLALEQQSRKFESQLSAIGQSIFTDSVEEKIRQMVDARVNELLPEYSRANWDNFRRQDKLSRFDRIFQEIIPQYNKLAYVTDSSQLSSTYEDLTSMLMQKLEIARDMYLKEIVQNQSSSKLSLVQQEAPQPKSQIKQVNIEKENDEEMEEERKEAPEIQKSKVQVKPNVVVVEQPLVMNKKESRYEDDSIVEERLKNYQERLRKESQNEEQNIKKILEEKEQQAIDLNNEIVENRHKDFPDEVVNKAKEIASLTQENPNIYLQYVLDYKNLSVNDLIDQLFNTNVMERYNNK